MSTYQCSVCFYICDLNPEVIEKFQANNYRLPHWKKRLPFAHGNFRKSAPEFLVEWSAPMDSEEHTGKRCNLWSLYQNGILTWRLSRFRYSSKYALKSLKRRALARQAILLSQIYPWNSDFITTSQGVMNLSQIYSRNSVIPSFRNRIYSGNKVIPEIRHIYPWNRVIPPFRNRPLELTLAL